MDRDNWDCWRWLKAATDAGWQDPGVTEPIELTVERAREYLEQLERPAVTVAAGPTGNSEVVRD